MRAGNASFVARLGSGRLCRPLGLIAGFFLFIGLCNFAMASNLNFNWPAPCGFTVDDISIGNGKTFDITYSFEFSKTNGGFILACTNVQLIGYNGKSLNDADQARLRPVAEMYRFPNLKFDTNGSFVCVLDEEDAIERVQKVQQIQQGLNGTPNDQPKDGLKRFYESEAGKKALNQVYGKIWAAWAGVWIGLDLKESDSISKRVDLGLGQTEPLPADETWTDVGPVKGETNLIHLHFEQKTDGKDLPAMLKPYMHPNSTTDSSKSDMLSGDIRYQLSTFLDAHINPETLQPSYVRQEITAKAKQPGADEKIYTQTHVYTFNWDKP